MSTQAPPLPNKSLEIGNQKESSLKTIIDFQELAPSPSQTFYQLVVYPFQPPSKVRSKSRRPDEEEGKIALNFDKIRLGCVVLRDWPRKRMSQNWRRGGLVNPGEKIISFSDFCDGEYNTVLISIFGCQKYDQALAAAKEELKKQQDYASR
jgi:hypothetical protein